MRAWLPLVLIASLAHADSPAAESARSLFEAKQYARALAVATTACDRDDTDACAAGIELVARPESIKVLGTTAAATQRDHFAFTLAGR